MKKLLYELRYFLAISGIFIAIVLILISSTHKTALHLYINQQHNSIADVFFKYYTNVGDGAFPLLLLPFLLFFGKVKHFIFALFSCALGGCLAQFFKRVCFPDVLRPVHFFNDNVLHTVEGVHLHSSHSLPSGHTASAFAFFMFLAFIGKKNTLLQYLCAILAILVAYSRVYLSHHFLIDVFGGALVGIMGFCLAYLICNRMKGHQVECRIIDSIRMIRKRKIPPLSLN